MHDGSPFATCDGCGKSLWRGRCGRDRCERNSARWLRRHCRRLQINLAACTGELLMFTITGPGGSPSQFDVWAWNTDSWRRMQRLRDLAGKQASREVPDVSSRLVAWVPELQARGMLHFHLVFEASNLAEKRWAERYCRYLRAHAVEHGFGPQTAKGRWGREAVGRYVSKLAGYLTKGSDLRESWEAGDVPPRAFYVARRLTDVSGCTMRRLRLSGRLWAAERLSVPAPAMAAWAGYERAFGRPLTRWELLCLPGVSQRGPPPLGAAVGSDSAR
jgi:hypothetical protein